MLKPLEQWICDVCGEVIEKPENGNLVFERNDDQKACNFMIVHSNGRDKCDSPKSKPYSLNLKNSERVLTDLNGQARLFDIILSGLPTEHEDNKIGVASLKEFLDVFRRLQLPYYEEARQYFNVDWVQKQYEMTYAGLYPDHLKDIVERCTPE